MLSPERNKISLIRSQKNDFNNLIIPMQKKTKLIYEGVLLLEFFLSLSFCFLIVAAASTALHTIHYYSP